MPEKLIIGGAGFVGSTLVNDLGWPAPTHRTLDITDLASIKSHIKSGMVVVNCAGFTNVKAATIDPNGPAWKLNVEGTRNLAQVCKEVGAYLIHLSTDGVFPTTDNSKGPHTEVEKINDDPNFVSAYGYTKLRGEKEVIESGAKAAVLRIAYPFGNTECPDKDYIIKIIKSIKLGYGLFSDQQFTPTYITSLPKVIEMLSNIQLMGVFHWVCKGLTTPYEIGIYVNKKLGLGLEVREGSLAEFEKIKGKQPYAKFGGLSTKLTERELGLKPPSWQEAIDDFIYMKLRGLV
ncbi:MAG: sugar nucleotide-binding protein [bacterium]|nr:sugar nucleotide-binding protein [bacterium]